MRGTSLLAGLVAAVVAGACLSSTTLPPVLDGTPPDDAAITLPQIDGGGGDDSGQDAAVDASACLTAGDAGCNALQLCGPEITEVDLTTASPLPTAGTIYNGAYVLTSLTFYQLGTTTESATQRQMFVITGGVDLPSADGGTEASVADAGAHDGAADGGAPLPEAGPLVLTAQEIYQLPPQPPVADAYEITLGTQAEMTWKPSCGMGAAFLCQYTATTTDLTLFVDVSGIGMLVAFYSRQ